MQKQHDPILLMAVVALGLWAALRPVLVWALALLITLALAIRHRRPTEATPLQLVIKQAKAQPLAAHGEIGNGRADPKVDLTTSALQFGNSQTYLLRRLARDQPELLDQIGPLSHPLAALGVELMTMPATRLREVVGVRSKRLRKVALVEVALAMPL
jgi:hypothetical protein